MTEQFLKTERLRRLWEINIIFAVLKKHVHDEFVTGDNTVYLCIR